MGASSEGRLHHLQEAVLPDAADHEPRLEHQDLGTTPKNLDTTLSEAATSEEIGNT